MQFRAHRETEQAWRARDQVLAVLAALLDVAHHPAFAAPALWERVLALLLDTEARVRSRCTRADLAHRVIGAHPALRAPQDLSTAGAARGVAD